MTERIEFWWITSTVWGLPDPTPARFTFDGADASRVHAFGADEIYRPRDVRLIERVLPPGRATAAISTLGGLLEEERLDVLSWFCSHCGTEQGDRRCQCWNDE